MKLSSSSLCSSLLLAAPVSASLAHVYIANDKAPASSSNTVLSPSTARLVLAHRLGLSEFHRLDGADDDAISALNQFGGEPAGLFGASSTRGGPRTIAFIEGHEERGVLPQGVSRHALRFDIDNTPTTDDNEQLLKDFELQSAWLAQEQDTTSNLRILQLSKNAGFTATGAHDAITGTLDVDSELIIVVVPEPATKSIAKKSSAWGSYESVEKLQKNKRQDGGLRAGHHASEIAPVDEAGRVSRPFITRPQQEDDDAPSSNSTAPSGILPACFSSIEDCQRITHRCSGRGTCKSKYRYSEGDRTRECFACSCRSVVRTNEEGQNSTTHWSGPACQKKDVSAEFWLLGGATIGLLSVVTFGIGMLYSMGQAELPSVIGAGVAGPRAK